MVAFADLTAHDVVRLQVANKQFEFQLAQKARLDIVGGGAQVRFDLHRPLAVTGSLLLQDVLPGKKPTIWFAQGIFPPPQETGPLGTQVTLRGRAPFRLRKNSHRQLRFGSITFEQRQYDAPGSVLLAERLVPKRGMSSNYHYHLFQLTEADIQRQ